MGMKPETKYQNQHLIPKLYQVLPGCHIQKNDPRETQGILDLLILFRDRWAMLEVKASLTAPYRPNQEHYIEHFGNMSFAAMICPENEEDVLHDLQLALGVA